MPNQGTTGLGLTARDIEQDYDEIPTWALAVLTLVGLGALYASVYIALFVAVAMGWHA